MDERSGQSEAEQWVCGLGPPGESVAGGPRDSGVTATDSAHGGALFVTHPALLSVGSGDVRVLLAGIDTLDFGMYVEFDGSWRKILAKLAQLKALARGTTGRVIGGGRCAVLPGGKPNFPFHLQYPGFQLYLSRKSRPDGETPNVFVSLNSQLLWDRGERAAVELVQKELDELANGTVRECRMSRCDLAVDLLVPGGVTDRFVRDHKVSHVREERIIVKNDVMQTIYVGASDSEISLRIYNKSAEILHSEKLWFLPLWGLTENADVWRFEFQIRRPMLNACQINSLDDLLTKRADLWVHLTHDWFSLRLHDNENVTRRTVHPLWRTLQECAVRFGPSLEPLQRLRCRPSTDPARVVKQAAASLVGFAARTRLTTLDAALQELLPALRAEFDNRDFGEACQRKAIQLGIDLKEESK